MMNGTAIGGATGSSYTAVAGGAYSIAVSNASCSDTSALTNVTVNALPATPVITQAGNTLTASAADAYQWYENGMPVSGATLQSYDVTADGVYSVVVSNISGCEATSDTMTVITTGIAALGSSNSVNVYPNPYAGATSIRLTLASDAMVTVEVYAMTGERVQTLTAQHYSAGTHTFTFGAKQQGYAAGIYLVKTTINDTVKITRIVENN